MMSSGASWDPSRDTQGNPTDSANSRTSADLPIPGGPQIKIGKTGATFSKKVDRPDGVRTWAASMWFEPKRVKRIRAARYRSAAFEVCIGFARLERGCTRVALCNKPAIEHPTAVAQEAVPSDPRVAGSNPAGIERFLSSAE